MANLVMTEAPGGFGDCYQCPLCGRMYLAVVLDDQGQPTAEPADAPSKCRRCGSPMDLDVSQKFQDARAEEATKSPERPTQRRRTVKV